MHIVLAIYWVLLRYLSDKSNKWLIVAYTLQGKTSYCFLQATQIQCVHIPQLGHYLASACIATYKLLQAAQ